MFEKIQNMLKVLLVMPKEKNIDYYTWIFSSSSNEKYNYNSKYLFEYILKYKPHINPRYVINDKDLRIKMQKKYGEEYFIETNSIEGIRKVLQSGVWFTSASLPVYGFNLNKNRLIVNLWHGIPLKKIALMEENVSFVMKMYFKYIFSENYTYILTTSNKLISIMAESFRVQEDIIKVWGQPRNDFLFIKKDKKRVLNILYDDLPSYENIILYAPTYRDEYDTKLFPFRDFTTNELNQFLEKNKIIIFIRTHQDEAGAVDKFLSNRVRLINEDKIEDIAEILNIFDMLITDYSSIYIDYLLTEKPIIFLPYDKEQYLKNRGFNFNYENVTPGPKPKTFIDFKKEMTRLLNDEYYYKRDRTIINDFFNEVKEPSSKNITEKILNDIKKLK